MIQANYLQLLLKLLNDRLVECPLDSRILSLQRRLEKINELYDSVIEEQIALEKILLNALNTLDSELEKLYHDIKSIDKKQ